MENKELGVRMVFKDPITVRDQMIYLSTIVYGVTDETRVLRKWEAAVSLIEEWECEIFPDHHASLSNVFNLDITNALIWAAVEAEKHINSLSSPKKK